MLEIIHTPVTILHVLTCLVLMLVILLQPGQSGGLGALTGQAATQVFGGRGAGNLLTKTSWVGAAIFFLTSVGLAYMSSSTDTSLQKRATAAKHESAPVGSAAPAAPAPAKSE